MSTQIDEKAFREELEKLGEAEVRSYLDRKLWGSSFSKINIAHSFLRELESARRDARDAETLDIANEANRIASKALRSNVRSERAAWIAAIAAIIAAIAAISDSFIFSSSSTEVKGETSEVSTNESPNKTN